ncbi:MAG: 7-cyano-7-deazaguanine synthase QueC [Candidatus Krumholzibacteriia bacterium]
MARPLAVVLASGGLDSCVCVAEAAVAHDLALLHVNYGQRTETRELQAFEAIAAHYAAPHRLVVDVGHLKAIGGSSLLDSARPMEEGLPRSGAPVPSTYVPFRNAHLLCIAVSWAEVLGARAVYLGAVEEDGSGYPDCREEFFRAFAAAVDAGTRPDTRVTLATPLLRLDKAAIVRRGVELAAPLQLTWSCYRNERRACGRCESCRLRLRGFAGAGIADPISYEDATGFSTGSRFPGFRG